MAFAIFMHDNLYRIASNTTEKNQLNVDESAYTIKEITDEQFSKIKLNKVMTSLSGGEVSLEDIPFSPTQGTTEEHIDFLKGYHEGIKKLIKEFLNPSNTSKSLYSVSENYLNYLNNLDYNSLTYPLNKTWEEYCEDNSISFINPLQLP
jgi:hypothetical protein